MTSGMPDLTGADGELDLILNGTYTCARVWEAWDVGTMTEEDFEEAAHSPVVDDLIAWRDAAVAKALGLPAENTATFTVDGEIRSAIAKPRADPEDECLCCRPLGHVYGFGVDIPSVTRPGINGQPVAGSANDWISDLLYRDYRRDHGRKVRVTLEILPAGDTTTAAGEDRR